VPGRSILLISYFFPPTRDTGAQRPAALAKYLAMLGNRVTVLTTSAFGEGAGNESVPGVEVIRTADLQSYRARLAGHGRIDSLFDSDTYSGRPHPLSYAVVPEPLRHLAYADIPLPVGHGQNISQPFVIALMTQLARVKKDDVVFETGTGAGYQAAILSLLAKRVYSVEYVEALARNAAVTLDTITAVLCDAEAPPVSVLEIPTLSGSAMILLMSVLALSGFAAIRRWGM